MAKFQLREFEPGDYERIAEIFGALEPEHPPSIEELRYNDETFDRSKYVLKRYVALENSGLVIGIARYSHTPWMFHPKKFWMGIYVDPAKQRHGVGTALYERIIQDLRFIGAITVRATAREDRPEAVSFLSKRGFKEKMRSWESTLEVPPFDFAKFQTYLQRASSYGIEISTLAEEVQSNSDCYRKLHELFSQAAGDAPLPDRHTPTSFEEFMKDIIQNPDTIPEGFFIAKDGDKYLGLSSVWRIQREPTKLHQFFTAVLREYRGRGVATALKLKVMNFAKRYGAREIVTFNDSTNKPILAINEKLGFRRHVGRILFEKDMATTSNPA